MADCSTVEEAVHADALGFDFIGTTMVGYTKQSEGDKICLLYTSYPDLTRKIYIKGYRYNLHLVKRAMLVEVGAQNNTVKEAENAMKPLAEMLYRLLSGEKSYKK